MPTEQELEDAESAGYADAIAKRDYDNSYANKHEELGWAYHAGFYYGDDELTLREQGLLMGGGMCTL